MHIRPARAADVPAVDAIVQAAYIERIGRRPAPMDADHAARVRNDQVWVAEDDGVLGLVVLVAEPDHLFVENVAVAPEHQRTGIGRALLAFAEEHARAGGREVLRLYTNAAMTENLALYARLGYQEDGRGTGSGFARVHLSKRVGPLRG